MFLKNSPKSKYDTLTPALLKKMSKKEESLDERVIGQETDGEEIAEIISKKLLNLIEKRLLFNLDKSQIKDFFQIITLWATLTRRSLICVAILFFLKSVLPNGSSSMPTRPN